MFDRDYSSFFFGFGFKCGLERKMQIKLILERISWKSASIFYKKKVGFLFFKKGACSFFDLTNAFMIFVNSNN